MDNYYTPDIEDIRVGYECERPIIDYSSTGPFKEWEKYTVGQEVDFTKSIRDRKPYYLPNPESLRTPYLTKEQIEAEGWLGFGKAKLEDGRTAYEKGNYFLVYHENKATKLKGRIEIILKNVILDNYTEWTSNGRLYLGECKSINEFRYISKLLGI